MLSAKSETAVYLLEDQGLILQTVVEQEVL
jgi:hypothetical protein